TARVGFTKEDLDAALARYGQVLDISRDDLEAILLETEAQAYGRRFGIITCGAIMSTDALTVRPETPLPDAWRVLRRHGLHALPVLDEAGRVVGVVGQNDFLHHAGLDDYAALGMRGGRAGKVADIMQRDVQTVGRDEAIAELVPLMTNRGLHHIPVVDGAGIFTGVVSHSDLLAALFEGKLMDAA
ncbi:MAG: CBS domain-containing protein, partial [Telluria sp.]